MFIGYLDCGCGTIVVALICLFDSSEGWCLRSGCL